MAETTTVRISVGDSQDEIDLPRGVIPLLAEGDQTAAETIGDLVTVGCMQRLHGVVHHGQGDLGDDIRALEEAMDVRFEERFGTSFAALLDHEH